MWMCVNYPDADIWQSSPQKEIRASTKCDNEHKKTRQESQELINES